MIFNGSRKLLLGQGSVDDSGSKTKGKDGWRYPNGTWVTAADVGWTCGLSYGPEARYTPCLFDEDSDDVREMHDRAPAEPAAVSAMWQALNRTLLTAFTARSPPELLGPCNAACAAAHWRRLGGTGEGPICGVPGCPAVPPPGPPPPPVGPFRPVAATNCTFRAKTGSHDGAISRVRADNTTACCAACFETTFCVLATFFRREGEGRCALHRTMTTIRNDDAEACVTGRATA